MLSRTQHGLNSEQQTQAGDDTSVCENIDQPTLEIVTSPRKNPSPQPVTCPSKYWGAIIIISIIVLIIAIIVAVHFYGLKG